MVSFKTFEFITPHHLQPLHCPTFERYIVMSTSPQAGPSNPTYRALKTEQGVFTTPVYSAAIKPHWRIKDEATARRSAQAIWGLFESYRCVPPSSILNGWTDHWVKFRDQDDFIGSVFPFSFPSLSKINLKTMQRG